MANSSTWVVTRQVPDQYDFTAPGDPVLGTIVHFETGLGESGSVFVPAKRYNAHTVRAMVAAAAAAVDEIAQLTSDT